MACNSRTPSDLEAVVGEIGEKGYPRALAVPGDVNDPLTACRIVKKVQATLGSIDVLINNAGISRISDIEHEKSMSAAFEVINVNIKGTMSFIHAVTPSMKARKSGVIINIVSVLGTIDLPFFSAYSAAKAAIIRATAIVDHELRPHGIYTYAVAPGMVANTTLGEGAVNLHAYEHVEDLQNFVKDFRPSMTDELSLPADTLVALVRQEDAKWMSGKYVDVTQDLGEVLEEAKKGSESRIEKEGLYTLKVATL